MAADDYFEVDRLVEELAKIYATACATAWFRVEKHRPTPEEYRKKVAEFMRHLEHTLATFTQQTPEAARFVGHVKKELDAEVARVLGGQNKDVEKRYKYFVDYS